MVSQDRESAIGNWSDAEYAVVAVYPTPGIFRVPSSLLYVVAQFRNQRGRGERENAFVPPGASTTALVPVYHS